MCIVERTIIWNSTNLGGSRSCDKHVLVVCKESFRPQSTLQRANSVGVGLRTEPSFLLVLTSSRVCLSLSLTVAGRRKGQVASSINVHGFDHHISVRQTVAWGSLARLVAARQPCFLPSFSFIPHPQLQQVPLFPLLLMIRSLCPS